MLCNQLLKRKETLQKRKICLPATFLFSQRGYAPAMKTSTVYIYININVYIFICYISLLRLQ